MDGRAMFATMNGNNLKTKTNPENGFPIYDFMYLYAENFDGTLANLMHLPTNVMPYPISNNYVMEKNSESYVRFRYGRNRTDANIRFYKSTQKIGLYSGNSSNENRFPKYENSFYFYFGLKPGSTAIDKLRTQFYSECRNDEEAQSVVRIEYEGNNWCSEVTGYEESFNSGDGWLKIDATYVEAPYKLLIKNLSGDSTYGYYSEEPLEYEKIFISNNKFVDNINCYEQYDLNNVCSECENYPPEGYTWLTQNNQPFGLLNGMYRIQITDANGGVFSQDINFTKPLLDVTISSVPFRYKNEELSDIVKEIGLSNNQGDPNTGDTLLDIAQCGGRQGENMSTRKFGGFAKITDVSQEENKKISFSIDVEPLFDMLKKPKIISGTEQQAVEEETERGRSMTSYNGSHVEIYGDDSTLHYTDFVVEENYMTLMKPKNDDIRPYCPYTYDCPLYTNDNPVDYQQINGGNYDIRIGVPKGGEKYKITVTMLCKKGDKYCKTRNKVISSIVIPEPIKFQMFINNIDYELIKNFKTGWKTVKFSNNRGECKLVSDSDPMSEVKGWTEISNIDGLVPLELLDNNSSDKSYEYIERTEQILSNNTNFHSSSPSPYNWVGEEYVFNPEDILQSEILTFKETPETRQSNVKFIRVWNEEINDYCYWIWDSGTGEYIQYQRFNDDIVTVISLEEYYDKGLEENDLDAKNQIIETLNLYVRERQTLTQEVEMAFVLTDKENGTSLSITNKTYEKPVKTIIFYSPDGEGGYTDHYSRVLDKTFQETNCYGITVGTISGALFDEDGEFLYDIPHPYQYNVNNGLAYVDTTEVNEEQKTALFRTVDDTVIAVVGIDSVTEINEIHGVSVTVTGGALAGTYDAVVSVALQNMGIKYMNNINGSYNDYKAPFWVGIQNDADESLPSLAPYTLNATPDYDHIFKKSFGVHFIEKDIKLAYNSWAPMSPWLFYYNERLYGNNAYNPMSYFNEGSRDIEFPGLFAGFILNGVPESYDEDMKTYFSKSYIDGPNTQKNCLVVTLSVNENNSVDETRIPVVRFVYNQDVDNSNYNDYDVSPMLNDLLDGELVGKQHILFEGRKWGDVLTNTTPVYEGYAMASEPSNYTMVLESEGQTYSIPIVEEVPVPEVSYTYLTFPEHQYNVQLKFPEGYFYTYFTDQENPVYKKKYEGDGQYIQFPQPDIVVANNPTMAFQCDDFDWTSKNNVYNNTFDYQNPHTLFVVQISKDKQQRAISRTYDLRPVEYRLGNVPVGTNIAINLGSSNDFNYLRYYPFVLTFYNASTDEIYYQYQVVDVEETIYQQTNDIYYCLIRNIPVHYTIIDSLCYVTIMDASGLERKMSKITEASFSHHF